MNLCEIGLFHIVWGVSKGAHDNYKIWLQDQYISISGVCGVGLRGPPCIFCLLFTKTEKVQEHDLY